MASQPTLFDLPVLPGLQYHPHLLSEAEEQELVARIDAIGLAPFRFHGWEGKRLTASFGWRYDFDHARFAPASPLPDWLLPVRDRAAGVCGLAAEELVHALLIRYDPGARIGWHRDRPVFEHVVGISLGAPVAMRFRRRRESGFDRRSVPLAARSMYHLSGEARHGWEHSITGIDATRWSITFRSLSEAGRRIGAG